MREINFVNNPSNDESYVVVILDENGNKKATLQHSESEKVLLPIGSEITIALDPTLPQELLTNSGVWPNRYIVKPYSNIQIIDAGRRFEQSRRQYSRIDNADASRCSYDLLKIDPFFIDYDENHGGGLKKQIFEKLDDTGVDWEPLDGNIALKRQFSFSTRNAGSGSDNTVITNSYEEFTKSMTVGIKTSAEIPKLAKGGKSTSVTHNASRGRDHKNIFGYSVDRIESYQISLVEDEVKLTNEFIKAVEDFDEKGKAKAFLQKWGTHYAKSVIYGGMRFGINIFDQEELFHAQKTELNVAQELQTNVKGVTLGAGGEVQYSEGEKYRNVFGEGSTNYKFVGGEGYRDNWNVAHHNAQPIEIELDVIYHLFEKGHFQRKNNNLAQAQLDDRKNWLESAINTHFAGSYFNEDTIPPPKFFQVTVKDLKVITVNDSGPSLELFGAVKISELYHRDPSEVRRNDPDPGFSYTYIWHVEEKDYVKKREGETIALNQTYSFIADWDMEFNTVTIDAAFSDDDGALGNDYIGNVQENLHLNDESLEMGQSVDRTFRLKGTGLWSNNKSEIEVNYTLHRFPDGLTNS